GIVYATDANNIVVEARDMTTGINYMRKKSAGTWGSWSADSGSGAFVLKAGDTMTGPLIVTPKGSMFGSAAGTTATGAVVPADANIKLYDFTSGNWSGMGVDGEGTFWLRTGTSAGAIPALRIHADKNVIATGNLTVNAGLTAGSAIIGTNTGNPILNLAGGAGANEGPYITYSKGGAVNWYVGSRSVILAGGSTSNDLIFYSAGGGGTSLILQANGDAEMPNKLMAGGYRSRAGYQSATNTGQTWNYHWTGSVLQAWVDNSNIGNVSLTCDYRAKRDIEPLPSTWQQVKALKPITFRYRDYGDLFKEGDDLQWGFLAHELQETLLPSAATGKKDEENIVQAPNLLAVIAGLTKALQEAMTRIEALEARQ
ncbi:MAG: tail fiber domain-containing protein, partial [Hyphomicrobiaceae bacterium]